MTSTRESRITSGTSSLEKSDLSERLRRLSAEKRKCAYLDLVPILVRSGDVARLTDLLTTLAWLEAKAEAGHIFDLAGDFARASELIPSRGPKRRVLRLLREAVLRDAAFIAKHPSTLFQCLWNSCWWYDCAEKGAYYKNGGHARSEGRHEESCTVVAPLLGRWRNEKAHRSPGFVWLRSLRPPPVPLGSALCVNCTGHREGVHDVAFSPDGSRLLTVSYDRSIRLWDAASGRQLRCTQAERGTHVRAGFVPDSTPVWIAAHRDGTVVMRDVMSGRPRAKVTAPHGVIEFLQLSRDGGCVLMGCRTGEVWVKRLAQEEPATRLDVNRGCPSRHPRSLAEELLGFHAVVRRLAQSGFAGSSRAAHHEDLPRIGDLIGALWKGIGRLRVAHTGEAPKTARDATITASALSVDGQMVALARDDGMVLAFETRTGRELATLNCASPPAVLAWMEGGKQLFGGGLDGVWCAEVTAREPSVESADGGPSEVTCLAALPDGNGVVCGQADGKVVVWDVGFGRRRCLFRGHARAVECVVVSRDGRLVASGSEDTTARVWELTGEQPADGPRSHKRQISCLEISYDERLCATGSYDGTVFLWSAQDGRPLACLEGHSSGVAQLLFSRDSKRLYTCSGDRTVRIWDVKRGKDVRRLEGHTRGVQAIDLSRNGKVLVSASDDATVRVWDGASGSPVTCLEGHEGPVQHVAVSAGGQLVASGAFDSTLRFWDVGSGQEVARLRSGSGESLGAPMVHFLAATGRVAIIWPDGTVRLWDLLESREVACRKPNGHIYRFAVAEDACRVVVETQDSEIWVWDGEELELIDRYRGFCLTWGDIKAISEGVSSACLKAWPTEGGSTIGLCRGEQAVAWCPSGFLSAVPTKRVWIGPDGPHLVAYQLEGDVDAKAGHGTRHPRDKVVPTSRGDHGEVGEVVLEKTEAWAVVADELRAGEM